MFLQSSKGRRSKILAAIEADEDYRASRTKLDKGISHPIIEDEVSNCMVYLYLVTVYPIISYGTIGLTPHAFWNISDFGAKCNKWASIKTKILE